VIDLQKTDRGFAIYGEGTCTYGHTWMVIESSIAGPPHCWLFVDHPDGSLEGSLHLGTGHVKSLLSQLERFSTHQTEPNETIGTGTCRYGVNWLVRDCRGYNLPEPSQKGPMEWRCCSLLIEGKLELEQRGKLFLNESQLFLNESQTRELREYLQRFLDHSNSPDHWKNSLEYRRMWIDGEG
jgi:hypothetical protein